MNVRIDGFTSCVALAPPAHPVDDADARKPLKDSKCAKCRDVSKSRKGKPWQKVAAEYKDRPNAVAEVTRHMTEPSDG